MADDRRVILRPSEKAASLAEAINEHIVAVEQSLSDLHHLTADYSDVVSELERIVREIREAVAISK